MSSVRALKSAGVNGIVDVGVEFTLDALCSRWTVGRVVLVVEELGSMSD